ncbi:MAG: hypothetical protein II070_11515 [Treponema sp.]|nr:hypothetical protein [Treponema sp.]
MKRLKLLCLFFPISLMPLFAHQKAEDLLQGYLQNDLNVKKLTNSLQNQVLEDKATKISNGWNFKIESGTVTVTTDGEHRRVTFSPSAELSIPQLNNLTLGASADIKYKEEDSTDTKNKSLYMSVDLYSKNKQKLEVTKLKSERSVLEASRALQNGLITAEKDFYTELKSLYSTAASIVKAENDLYDDQLAFNEIRAKGYIAGSLKYRQAEMKVLSGERNVEINKRELERQTKIFASKCGIEYDGNDAVEFLPDSVPQAEAVDVLSFKKEAFAKIEKATWTNRINTLNRNADSKITVRGKAGYTFDNSSTDSDTLDLGSSLTWNGTGLTASAGVSWPLKTDSFYPVYTFGLSFSPQPFLLANITDQQKEIAEEQEKIDIQSAEKDYQTEMISRQTQLSDIQWKKKTNEESLDMYKKLAADEERYYRQGYVTLSEYRNAKANKENYEIQCLINDIELLIYNDETKLLFCRDDEIKAIK